MLLPQEMQKKAVKTLSTSMNVYCKVFENNSGALELARTPKLCLCAKHINVINHHFRWYVRDQKMNVPIDTFNQILDVFTKPLPQNDFPCQQKEL